MSGFATRMNDAFDGLKRSQACQGHVWTAPRTEESGFGKHIETRYATNCTVCGGRASRRTREQLIAEVIDA